MPYPVFKSMEEKVSDIFTDGDFKTAYFLKIKTAAPSGVVLTSQMDFDTKESKLASKVKGKWAHASGFTLEKLEMTQNGSVATETKLEGALPGLKLEFKGNDSGKADLFFTYSKLPHATLAGDLDVLNFEKSSLSAVTGFGPLLAGVSANICLKKKAVDTFNTTVGYVRPSCSAYAKANKSFSEFTGLAAFTVCPPVQLAIQAVHAKSTTTGLLACIYKHSPATTFKLKASSNGVVSAALKQDVEKKFSVIAACEYSQKNAMKFGVNASLG